LRPILNAGLIIVCGREGLNLHTITVHRVAADRRGAYWGRGCRLTRPRGVSCALDFARAAGHTAGSIETLTIYRGGRRIEHFRRSASWRIAEVVGWVDSPALAGAAANPGASSPEFISYLFDLPVDTQAIGYPADAGRVRDAVDARSHNQPLFSSLLAVISPERPRRRLRETIVANLTHEPLL